MAHLLARRSSNTSNVGDNWLGHVGLNPLGSTLFFRTTDFTNHHDCLCFRVSFECGEAVNEVRSRNWVSTDSYTCGLANTLLAEFVQRLVGKCSGPGNNSHRSTRKRNVTRSNSNVAFSGADDAWAVRAKKSNAWILFNESVVGHRFIVSRDSFSDANNERDATFSSFKNRCCGKLWWN